MTENSLPDVETSRRMDLDALRAPFPAKSIGKKPQPLKKDAQKARCPECGQWHGLPAIHLDFIGHAVVTDRLLTVDPFWTWEPMAIDPDTGGPKMDGNGGLWIRLTILGVTRPGYGDGDGDKSAKGVKIAIGDAIRNAAMRFGVALTLWSKDELPSDVGEQHDEPAGKVIGEPAETVMPGPELADDLDRFDTLAEQINSDHDDQIRVKAMHALKAAAAQTGLSFADVNAYAEDTFSGAPLDQLDRDQLRKVYNAVRGGLK